MVTFIFLLIFAGKKKKKKVLSLKFDFKNPQTDVALHTKILIKIILEAGSVNRGLLIFYSLLIDIITI